MYEGVDRRKVNQEYQELIRRMDKLCLEISYLKEKLESYHDNSKTYREAMVEDINHVKEVINGNGNPGIKTVLATLKNDLSAHVNWDRVLFVGIGSTLVLILTLLIKR